MRARLFPWIRDELVAHERGEMNVLYPALCAHRATCEMALRQEEATRKVEVVVGYLSGYSLDNPEWKDTAEILLEIFERHVGEEEFMFFPLAQEVLGAETVQELDERYCAYRWQLKQAEQGEERTDDEGMD